jgi:hypothetical protein
MRRNRHSTEISTRTANGRGYLVAPRRKAFRLLDVPGYLAYSPSGEEETTMPNDNKSSFGRYIISRQLAERVNEVVEKAVSDVERLGFTPVFDQANEHDNQEEAK